MEHRQRRQAYRRTRVPHQDQRRKRCRHAEGRRIGRRRGEQQVRVRQDRRFGDGCGPYAQLQPVPL